MASFKRNIGLRIDHIWVGKNIIPNIKSCIINKEMRKLERPSDHAAVTMAVEF
jgi:exodeoxyribonuclease-3